MGNRLPACLWHGLPACESQVTVFENRHLRQFSPLTGWKPVPRACAHFKPPNATGVPSALLFRLCPLAYRLDESVSGMNGVVKWEMAIGYRLAVRLALLAAALAVTVLGGVYLRASLASTTEFDSVSQVPEPVVCEPVGEGGDYGPSPDVPAVKIYRGTPGTNSPAPAHH